MCLLPPPPLRWILFSQFSWILGFNYSNCHHFFILSFDGKRDDSLGLNAFKPVVLNLAAHCNHPESLEKSQCSGPPKATVRLLRDGTRCQLYSQPPGGPVGCGSVGWSLVPYTTMLCIRSLVGMHMGSNQSIFLTLLFLSLSLPFSLKSMNIFFNKNSPQMIVTCSQVIRPHWVPWSDYTVEVPKPGCAWALTQKLCKNRFPGSLPTNWVTTLEPGIKLFVFL